MFIENIILKLKKKEAFIKLYYKSKSNMGMNTFLSPSLGLGVLKLKLVFFSRDACICANHI